MGYDAYEHIKKKYTKSQAVSSRIGIKLIIVTRETIIREV